MRMDEDPAPLEVLPVSERPTPPITTTSTTTRKMGYSCR